MRTYLVIGGGFLIVTQRGRASLASQVGLSTSAAKQVRCGSDARKVKSRVGCQSDGTQAATAFGDRSLVVDPRKVRWPGRPLSTALESSSQPPGFRSMFCPPGNLTHRIRVTVSSQRREHERLPGGQQSRDEWCRTLGTVVQLLWPVWFSAEAARICGAECSTARNSPQGLIF